MTDRAPPATAGRSPSASSAARAPAAGAGLWSELRSLLPQGVALPAATWRVRHRIIVATLAGHALLLPLFGALQGWAPAWTLGEGAAIAATALLASWPHLGERSRSVVASFGLVLSSAVLVQFSGGTIEAHFHYFIVVALIALYHDWAPFLLAILFVGLSHGILGMAAPHWVYNHHDALANPWKWALIHAVAVLGESVALLAFWAGAEQARARSDVVLNSAGDAVLGLDLQGRVTFANPAAAQLLGQPVDDLVGREVQGLLPGLLPSSARAESAAQGQGSIASGQGRAVPVEWTLTTTTRAGTALGAVAVLRDVSARRDLERQLVLHQEHLEDLVAQRTAQLTAANRELEAFSYTVSHDLRSPLRSLNGFSMLLLSRHGHELPPESRHMLESLSAGAVRMGNLIESVLSLSRISRTRLASESVDLSAMAHDILEEMAVKDPTRRVAWAVQPGLVTRGDPSLLRLALVNLLSNSWKFTSKAPDARISVHRSESLGPPVFVVEDNGAGFDMAHARDLFQPFHRMHQPHEFEGTGIGLATVARILQRHGGRIWAEGQPGQGARFYFVVGTPSEADLVQLREQDGMREPTQEEVAGPEPVLAPAPVPMPALAAEPSTARAQPPRVPGTSTPA